MRLAYGFALDLNCLHNFHQHNFLQVRLFGPSEDCIMRYETANQKNRTSRRRHDVYEAYKSSNFHTRTGSKHNDQHHGVVNMLDSFTNLCVGNYPTATRSTHGSQDKRKYKFVLYPIARYPHDRMGSGQGEPRRKRIKQHIFRPVSEDEKSASNHRRARR